MPKEQMITLNSAYRCGIYQFTIRFNPNSQMNPLDEKREDLTSVQRAEQTEQMKENFQSSAKMLDNL